MRHIVVFCDRDDTLIRTNYQGYYYITKPEQVMFCTGALEGLRKLKESHVKIFIITNQNGICDGTISREVLDAIHSVIRAKVIESGGYIDGISTTVGEGHCLAKTEAIIRQREYQYAMMDKADSLSCWMIGDLESDIEAGKRSWCRTIHIWYPESEFYIATDGDPAIAKSHLPENKPQTNADYEADNFREAIEIILKHEG